MKDMGLVNGAVGTLILMQQLCYQTGGPPDFPLAAMVTFDKYSGLTLHNGTVPVTLIPHSLSSFTDIT